MGSAGVGGDATVRSWARRAALGALLVSIGSWIGMSQVAHAEVCSAVAEHIRQEQVQKRSSLAPFSDCRAYEQVSPVDKNGVDASGAAGLVQTVPNGDAATFFSLVPSIHAGSAQTPSYLGARSPDGDEWSTQGLEALAPPGSGEKIAGVTGDVSKAIIEVTSRQAVPPCKPAVTVCGGYLDTNAYVRSKATGTFQFMAHLGSHPLGFADAALGGSRILFETESKLTPEANPGLNLYEWDEARPFEERVSLAGVLPGGVAPNKGSFAGPGGPATQRVEPRGKKWYFYTQNTISRDGSRIFFSDAETGDIYMREPEAEPAVTIPISAGQAYWRAATPDGKYVFYTEGSELYRFNVDKFLESGKVEPLALAEAREQLTVGAEGVLGVLGNSEDGSYVYFVAPGSHLASNENGNHEAAVEGTPNLYEWHEGIFTFIATLKAPGPFKVPPGDESDWRGWTNDEESDGGGPAGGEKASRVSSDGQFLLFSSSAKLTSYNNDGAFELYLYAAGQSLSSTNPVCVSCNPSLTPATGDAHLTQKNVNLVTQPAPPDAFLTQNLSSNGRRVFFETDEALVPGDANLQTDVYEWEANGEGSCESEAQNGGCVYLISTGQSTQRSYFGDASADGNSAFFFTRQSLVSQDKDNNVDLYVARVNGGISGQNPEPSLAPCAQEEACRGSAINMPSVFGTPASTTFTEAGNVVAGSEGIVKTKTAGQIRKEKLTKALRACKSKSRAKAKRTRCEAAARKRYGIPKTKAKKLSRRNRHS
jgi:hypothetical protein